MAVTHQALPLSMSSSFSLNRPRGRFSLVVRMFACPIARNRWLRPNGWSLRLLVEERIANIGIPLHVLDFCSFDLVLLFEFIWVLGSFQTSLLCLVGELAGGQSVAMAFGISNKWQVRCDMWHVICDMWHLTCDTWPVTHDFFFAFSVRFGIGATICTRWEIQCLP